tara:strand:- start:3815 stop:4345 length:531 start_codon:yes stop_codon:yes gene_type:complete
MGWKVKKEKIMNRVDYEKGGLNSVKVEEILNKFNNKIPTNTIINVCKEFDLINEIVKFDCRVEDVINEFLNIELEKEINNKKQIEINQKLRELNNKSILLKTNKIDRMRVNGNLKSHLNTLSKKQLNDLLMIGLIRSEEMSEITLRRFKENQKQHSTNYNELETENVSMSNPNVWK